MSSWYLILTLITKILMSQCQCSCHCQSCFATRSLIKLPSTFHSFMAAVFFYRCPNVQNTILLSILTRTSLVVNAFFLCIVLPLFQALCQSFTWNQCPVSVSSFRSSLKTLFSSVPFTLPWDVCACVHVWCICSFKSLFAKSISIMWKRTVRT